jgi:hypothetical protein
MNHKGAKTQRMHKELSAPLRLGAFVVLPIHHFGTLFAFLNVASTIQP